MELYKTLEKLALTEELKPLYEALMPQEMYKKNEIGGGGGGKGP